MKEQVVNEDVARKFLLGQLSLDQQGQIEELAFEDPETFALLESVEDDLIDEFIREELSPAEKERFEKYFLTLPGKKANLNVSRVLEHHFSKKPEPVRTDDNRISFLGLFSISAPTLRISLSAAAILIGLVIAVWLYVRSREDRQPAPQQAHNEQLSPPTPQPQISPTIQPTPQLTQNKTPTPKKARPEPRLIAAVILTPSEGVRSEAQPLTLPKTPLVPVELPLLNRVTYASYEATLKTEDEKVLKTWANLHARELQAGRGLLVQIPKVLLEPDELYQITVSGKSADGNVQHVASYPFQAKE